MDIEEAFDTAARMDVGDELKAELRDVILRIYQQLPEGADTVMDMGMLNFMAGRVYEQQFANGVDGDMLIKFIRFMQSDTEESR